jgi:GNAT superfamily N-acetyltransferase
MEPKSLAESERLADRPAIFSSGEIRAVQLSLGNAPELQQLLERCDDYYALVEGRPPQADAAIGELTEGPAERLPHDLFVFGILERSVLVGVIGALRNHRRRGQWYLGLMVLDPRVRNAGLGRMLYRAFEDWIARQDGDSILLAVVESNSAAARFWRSVGFGWPRCYPERILGLRRHVLIEFEKQIRP